MADAMKKWLRQECISYRRLAKEMNQSPGGISNKVNGHTPWSLNDLLWLKEHYGLSYEFVIDGKDPLHAVVLGGVFTPWGPLLTDDYGRPIRFSEYGDGPCRFGDTPVKRVKPNDWFVDRVCVLDDKTVASFKDDVARFVVEACRCFVGGDGDHDRSVVLCREGVAEQLDLSSDAFAPMVGSDGNAVSFGYQPCDRLRCVCSTNPAKGLGVFHVWTERGTTYQAVLGPCAYERRPEKTLTLPDELWSRNESWMRDFFEQETSDFLCLGVVSRRTYFGLVRGNSARG